MTNKELKKAQYELYGYDKAKYYQDNKEHIRAYQKEYYYANQEVIKEKARVYREENKERLTIYNREYKRKQRLKDKQ